MDEDPLFDFTSNVSVVVGLTVTGWRPMTRLSFHDLHCICCSSHTSLNIFFVAASFQLFMGWSFFSTTTYSLRLMTRCNIHFMSNWEDGLVWMLTSRQTVDSLHYLDVRRLHHLMKPWCILPLLHGHKLHSTYRHCNFGKLSPMKPAYFNNTHSTGWSLGLEQVLEIFQCKLIAVITKTPQVTWISLICHRNQIKARISSVCEARCLRVSPMADRSYSRGSLGRGHTTTELLWGGVRGTHNQAAPRSTWLRVRVPIEYIRNSSRLSGQPMEVRLDRFHRFSNLIHALKCGKWKNREDTRWIWWLWKVHIYIYEVMHICVP